MYAKVFTRMLDGRLGDSWEHWTTWVAVLMLADADGVVDMTEAAICRRTSLPPEAVRKGLAFLSSPDPSSTLKDAEGRRILPMDNGRWCVVNHSYYRNLKDPDQVREANRERQRRHRERLRDQSVTPRDTQATERDNNAESHHTDTDTDTDTDRSSYPTGNSSLSPTLNLVNPPGQPPELKAVAMMPLNNGGTFPVLESHVERWAKLYPAVDVRQHVRNMQGWLEANRRRRKTDEGVERFIHAWLKREQDRPREERKGTRRRTDDEYAQANLGGGE